MMIKMWLLLLFFSPSQGSESSSKDLIYAEMMREFTEVKSALDAEKKKLEEEFLPQFKKAEPQTGKYKFARKRWEDSLARKRRLEQIMIYYQVAMQKRADELPILEARARANSRPWPDTKEYQEYLALRNLRFRNRNWSVKQRQLEEGVFQPKKTSQAKQSEGH
ncbi:MAG: hypothetical protein WCH11_03790 [Bdellovibrio sp.]